MDVKLEVDRDTKEQFRGRYFKKHDKFWYSFKYRAFGKEKNYLNKKNIESIPIFVQKALKLKQST